MADEHDAGSGDAGEKRSKRAKGPRSLAIKTVARPALLGAAVLAIAAKFAPQ
jgi:hypothetical protein